jgi:hypothetical protein
MPYKAHWREGENGTTELVVPGVLMGSFVTADERPDFALPGDMDAAFYARAEATAKQRKAKGKREGYLLKRHNGFLEAGHTGYLENSTFAAPYYRADVVVTNPDEIRATLRGERANISMESDYTRDFIWGLSLIEGAEGHFSEEIPEFRVEGVSLKDKQAANLGQAAGAALHAPEPELVALTAARNDKRTTMFTKEQEAAIGQIVADVLTKARADDKKERDEAIKAALTAHKPEPKEPKAGEDAEVAKLKKRAEEAEAKLAEVEGERELDGMVREYRAANGTLTDAQARKALCALSTSEARKVKLAAMKTAKLSTDDPAGEPDPAQGDGKKLKTTPEAFLRAEFKAKKISHCSEDEYVRLNKNFINPEELN